MIRQEISAVFAQHGMLPNMQIKGGNFPETVIRRNVFFPDVRQDWGLIYGDYIGGEIWVRHRYTRQPSIARVIAFPERVDKLDNLVFLLQLSELIPLDFLPEYAGAEGIR